MSYVLFPEIFFFPFSISFFFFIEKGNLIFKNVSFNFQKFDPNIWVIIQVYES